MSEQMPSVGSAAPDFRLPSGDGNELGLADLRGKWVVVYFYPKDNTSGCTTEAKEFTDLLPDFAALNAEVLGISKDSVTSHANFAAKHGLGVNLLADPELTVLQAYGAWRLKKSYGKESMGTVRSTLLVDPAGLVRRTWPNVAKGAGHAAKVLEALREEVARS